jgi:hypothetical protein
MSSIGNKELERLVLDAEAALRKYNAESIIGIIGAEDKRLTVKGMLNRLKALHRYYNKLDVYGDLLFSSDRIKSRVEEILNHPTNRGIISKVYIPKI